MNLRELWECIPEGLKHLLDGLSIMTLLGSLAAMLPAVASILTIVWTGIRIYETSTVQRWLGKIAP